MKTFIVLVAVVMSVQALTQEQKEKMKTYRNACVAESGVDASKIQNLVFVDDPKLHKYLLCYSKKMGFQNETGELQMDALNTFTYAVVKNPHKAKVILEKCMIQQKTPEHTAYHSAKCVEEHGGMRQTNPSFKKLDN